MVIGRKRRLARHFSGEQARRKRYPDNDGDSSVASFLNEAGRPLPENVVDDLYRLHARIFDRFQTFFDFLDRHTVAADLSRCDHAVHRIENLRPVIDLGRWTMKLYEIEPLHLQVLQGPVDKSI